MSKLSNILSMLKLLENGRIYKIKELADLLECSERSIRTYKEELEKSGIYVESIPGRYGGYYISSDYDIKYFNINKIDLNNFYTFIKTEISKNMNSLLIIPKNSFQKIYLFNTINFFLPFVILAISGFWLEIGILASSSSTTTSTSFKSSAISLLVLAMWPGNQLILVLAQLFSLLILLTYFII